MSIDRNAIFDALFQIVKWAGSPAVAGGVFVTTGKRLKRWDQVKAQPALYLCQAEDEYLPRPAQMEHTKVILNGEIWIYCTAVNPEEDPMTTLNPLLMALETALQPPPALRVQTLGLKGIVQHCWLEGTLKKGYDLNTGQLAAMVPVKILTTL